MLVPPATWASPDRAWQISTTLSFALDSVAVSLVLHINCADRAALLQAQHLPVHNAHTLRLGPPDRARRIRRVIHHPSHPRPSILCYFSHIRSPAVYPPPARSTALSPAFGVPPSGGSALVVEASAEKCRFRRPETAMCCRFASVRSAAQRNPPANREIPVCRSRSIHVLDTIFCQHRSSGYVQHPQTPLCLPQCTLIRLRAAAAWATIVPAWYTVTPHDTSRKHEACPRVPPTRAPAHQRLWRRSDTCWIGAEQIKPPQAADDPNVDQWLCRWDHTDQPNMGQVKGHPLEDLSAMKDFPWPDATDPRRYVNVQEQLDEDRCRPQSQRQVPHLLASSCCSGSACIPCTALRTA